MAEADFVVGRIEFDGRTFKANRTEEAASIARANEEMGLDLKMPDPKMTDFFEMIAVPKGSVPGGPVQTSAGNWVHVLSLWFPLSMNIKQVIEGAKLSRRVTVEEVDKAIDKLQALRADLVAAGK